jgi:N-acetylglucosamine malate deacetylase 1
VLFRTARRLRRRLPAHTREVALALAARATDGPTVLPGPPPGPVLVVAAHPDDETIGCGGALARHAQQGDDVTVLIATSGEATSGVARDSQGIGAVREHECRAACAALGLARPPVFLRLPDGRLGQCRDGLAAAIRGHGSEAATVYAPSLLDPHRDHRAANTALADAALRAEVFGYEIWAAGPVDALLDVHAVYDRKEAALRCYVTALAAVDYVRAVRGLAVYRSVAGGLGGTGLAEGFAVLDADDHGELARRAGKGDVGWSR